MSEKRITDRQDDTVEPGRARRPEVDRSRRRFTRGGLTASAILTLASRPAFGGFQCNPSNIMSGNVSQKGLIDRCKSAPPTAYLDKLNWPSEFYAGKQNPLETAIVTHDYPDKVALTTAIGSSSDGMFKDSCEAYLAWAWPPGTTTSIPSPDPEPDNFNHHFAGSGLVSTDGLMTLMQALERHTDELQGHVVAALFNCYVFGGEAYGFTPESLKAYIADHMHDPIGLLDKMRMMNNL